MSARYNITRVRIYCQQKILIKFIMKALFCSGPVVWHCLCDCGKEADVSETALVHGSQISCGCRVQEVGKELSNYLHFIDGTCIEFLKRRQRCDNKSGYPGVCRMKNGKYKAGITFKKIRYYLGTYDTFKEAKQERQKAELHYPQSFLKEHPIS